jgi:hypothetical protein
MRTLASLSVAVAVARLGVPAGAQSLSADNRTELAPRAVAGAPIRPEAQHRTLGELDARSPAAPGDVPVGEALLGEPATMGSGRNTGRGACRSSKHRRGTIGRHRVGGEDVAASEFRFAVFDGKARIETVVCPSTPQRPR